MALEERQVEIRGLVMGPGTAYRIMGEFNPFQLSARAPGSGERAWGHGGWSGAEWAEERVVPMRILVRNESALTIAGWLAAHQQLAAAFRPVGEVVEDVPLRFKLGGTEYVLFGRPRMAEPDTSAIGLGHAFTNAAFVALDPFIYAGEESSVAIGLPTYTGGLTVPFTVPFTVDATKVGGSGSAVNGGTAATGLLFRIDGPVMEPRVIVTVDGEAKILRFNLTLNTGEWLDVDTAAKTVIQNDTASRRGQTSGEWPTLPNGTHLIEFAAGEYNPDALLTVTWRSAWW